MPSPDLAEAFRAATAGQAVDLPPASNQRRLLVALVAATTHFDGQLSNAEGVTYHRRLVQAALDDADASSAPTPPTSSSFTARSVDQLLGPDARHPGLWGRQEHAVPGLTWRTSISQLDKDIKGAAASSDQSIDPRAVAAAIGGMRMLFDAKLTLRNSADKIRKLASQQQNPQPEAIHRALDNSRDLPAPAAWRVINHLERRIGPLLDRHFGDQAEQASAVLSAVAFLNSGKASGKVSPFRQGALIPLLSNDVQGAFDYVRTAALSRPDWFPSSALEKLGVVAPELDHKAMKAKEALDKKIGDRTWLRRNARQVWFDPDRSEIVYLASGGQANNGTTGSNIYSATVARRAMLDVDEARSDGPFGQASTTTRQVFPFRRAVARLVPLFDEVPAFATPTVDMNGDQVAATLQALARGGHLALEPNELQSLVDDALRQPAAASTPEPSTAPSARRRGRTVQRRSAAPDLVGHLLAGTTDGHAWLASLRIAEGGVITARFAVNLGRLPTAPQQVLALWGRPQVVGDDHPLLKGIKDGTVVDLGDDKPPRNAPLKMVARVRPAGTDGDVRNATPISDVAVNHLRNARVVPLENHPSAPAVQRERARTPAARRPPSADCTPPTSGPAPKTGPSL
jgi:hypothetical protein